MSFRILDQAPVYLNANGTIAAGGSLTFYETDLSTLKDTWSDEALTTLNSNPVLLDSAGRSVTDVWGDEDEYGVVLKNALGVVQWTRNNVRANEPQVQTIPDGNEEGDLLQWDGSAWVAVQGILVPDPTGLLNHQLVTDGTIVPIWQQIPEVVIPTPEYDVQSGSIRIGTLLVQWGGATIPAAPGAQTANVAVTFAEEFSGTPYDVVPYLNNAGGSTASGRFASLASTNFSTTGATITANVGEDDTRSDFKLTNTTPVRYIAIGPTTLPED